MQYEVKIVLCIIIHYFLKWLLYIIQIYSHKTFSRDENCYSHNFSIHSQFSILTTFKNHTQKVKQNCFNILNFCVLPWQISCNQYFWNLKYFKLFIPPWGQLLHFKRVIISFFFMSQFCRRYVILENTWFSSKKTSQDWRHTLTLFRVSSQFKKRKFIIEVSTNWVLKK